MKYPVVLFVAAWLSGCASITKQYYYEPSVAHRQVKSRMRHTDYKMVYSKVLMTAGAGDTIGSLTTANGTGQPLLMGPLLPVIPVGGFFQKNRGTFEMEMTVSCSRGHLLPLDSTKCYMIVNDTAKVPLRVSEQVTGDTALHSYNFYCNARFSKIKTMRLVTGNDLLDGTLKNIAFNRRSRIKFDLLGLGY
jgi:hypothetical protein